MPIECVTWANECWKERKEKLLIEKRVETQCRKIEKEFFPSVRRQDKTTLIANWKNNLNEIIKQVQELRFENWLWLSFYNYKN